MVGGFAVKRQNMYDMEEGEGSIWQTELGQDGRLMGRSGAFAPRARTQASASASADAVKTKKPAASAAKVRPQSDGERRRLANNDRLRAEAAVLAARRAAWFISQRALLEPFCEPKVLDGLATAAKKAPPPPAKRRLDVQPESVVGGEMRDYQLTGLSWFVDCLETRGMSTILGDEMGLGKVTSLAVT